MAKRAKKAVQKEAATDTPTKKRGRPAGKRSSASVFSRLIAGERKRLQKLYDKVAARRADIEREFNSIASELQAITAYFTGSAGKGGNGRSASARSGARPGRGQRRQQVLDAIKSSLDGATRGDVL